MKLKTDEANKIDLHIHSHYSDGSMSPADIVGAARDAGLRVIAFTDHDTVSGVREALEAAEAINNAGAPAAAPGSLITVIPGVEISVDYAYPLHMLGYFRRDSYEKIGVFLENMTRERHMRNVAVIRRLNEIGIDITVEEVAKIAGIEIFGRPHIADALVKKNIVRTYTEAFQEYLLAGRIAYVEKRSLPPEECAAAIADAGGLPVIAHPANLGMKLRDIKTLVKSLIKSGLYGIEAYYSENTSKETENFVKLAHELKIQTTGGSDFHGEYRKYVKLGSGADDSLRMPESVADEMMKALYGL